MEPETVGNRYRARCGGVPGARRRLHSRLAVSRTPNLEPIGGQRENFYSQRLLLTLAWYCDQVPEACVVEGKPSTRWNLKWCQPFTLAGRGVPPITLQVATKGSTFSYEERCHYYETVFSSTNLVCQCCAEEIPAAPCDACRYAVGWHVCPRASDGVHRWRRTSLFGGTLDIQRVLFNLHRRMFPIDVLRSKALEYVEAGLVSEPEAQTMVRVIEARC